MTDDEMIALHHAGLAQAADALCYFGEVFTRVHGPHPAGHVHAGHEHRFDHQTLLVSGAIAVVARKPRPDGAFEEMGCKEFRAPCPIVIRADTWHEITALEDNTVWICVFAVRDMGEPMFSQRSDPYV